MKIPIPFFDAWNGCGSRSVTVKESFSLSRLRRFVLAPVCSGVFIFLLLQTGWAADRVVHTAPLNRDPAVRAAYDRFYILDYAGALDGFRKVAADHPGDPIATDYVIDATLFAELYRLDLLDTTLYAHDGFLNNRHPVTENKQLTAQLFDLIDKAVDESDERLKKDPKDVNALYARGWARSMKATYIGLVQHGFVSALHLALQSRSDDEKVLGIDPDYVDADLVVGVHQYVAGCLPLAFKMVAGLVGESGNKQKGLALLREAGQYGVITSVEARTALMLFLRREAKYPEAAQVAKSLKDQYPRDFLFWLEEANLMKDSGDARAAINRYRQTLEQAKKPGYFPNAHLELAWYGLGDTLRGQHQTADSAYAFSQVASQPGVNLDLKRRAELAAGEQYDMLQQRDRATAEYQAVLRDGADSPQAPEAQKFLRTPFRGQ
jgi:tetratricopeptide (TPR) repeat protein